MIASSVSRSIARSVAQAIASIGAGVGSPLVITPSSANPVAGVDVDFESNAAELGTPVSYTWDFGDGTVPGSGASIPDHFWVGTIAYTVTITVVMDDDSTYTDTVVITPTAPAANANLTRVATIDFDVDMDEDSTGDWDNISISSDATLYSHPIGAKPAAESGVGNHALTNGYNFGFEWNIGDPHTTGDTTQLEGWFFIESLPGAKADLIYVRVGGTSTGWSLQTNGNLTYYASDNSSVVHSTPPLNTWFWLGMTVGPGDGLSFGFVDVTYMHKTLQGSVSIVSEDTYYNGWATSYHGIGVYNSAGNQAGRARVSKFIYSTLSSIANAGYSTDIVQPQDEAHIFLVNPDTGDDTNDGVTAPFQTVTKLNALLDATFGIMSIYTSGTAGSGHHVVVDTSTARLNLGQTGLKLAKHGTWLKPASGQTYIDCAAEVIVDPGDWTETSGYTGIYQVVCNQTHSRLWSDNVYHAPAVSLGALDGMAAGASFCTQAVEGATNATPIVVTATNHGLSNGEQVVITGVVGNTAANGTFTIGSVTTDTFTLVGSVGNGAYTTAGTFSTGKIYVKPMGGTDPRVDGKTYRYSRFRPEGASPIVGLPAVAPQANDVRVTGCEIGWLATHGNGSYAIGDISGFGSTLIVEDCHVFYGDKHLICYTIDATNSTITTRRCIVEQSLSQALTSYMTAGSGNVHLYEDITIEKATMVERSSAGAVGQHWYSHGAYLAFSEIEHRDCNYGDNYMTDEPIAALEAFTRVTVNAVTTGNPVEFVDCIMETIPIAGELGGLIDGTTVVHGATIIAAAPIVLGGEISVTDNSFDLRLANTTLPPALWEAGTDLELTFTGNTVRFGSTATHLSVPIFQGMETAEIISCDYNTYYIAADAVLVKDFDDGGGAADYTFSEWQALGYDTHSTRIEPGTPVAPVNTVLPVITGSTVENETLSCSTGTWTGTAIITYTRQWLRDSVAISGATGATYDLVTADVDAMIGCEVTATNSVGDDSALAVEVGPVTEPAPLLLDTYSNAAAAYSLRKLRTAYAGSCIRVRRTSDDTEQDIGFDGSELDTTALLAFCGANDGRIVTWYDQSGNGDNVTQATASFQPRIVASGVVDLEGAKPTLFWQNARVLTFSSALGVTAASIFAVYNQTSSVDYGVLGTGVANSYWRYAGDGDGYIGLFSATRRDNFPATMPATGHALWESFHSGTSMNVKINGTDKGTNTTQSFSAGSNFQIGFSGAAQLLGTISEVIVFDSDMTADRAAINAEIKAYWGTP